MNKFKRSNWKKLTLVIFAILLPPTLYLGYQHVDQESKLVEVFVEGDYFIFEDSVDIEEFAEVVALVRVEDDLTSENSTVMSGGSTYAAPWAFYGARDVTVLEYYKNSGHYGEQLTIHEPAAITSNNELIRYEMHEPLEKGKEYIVFLGISPAFNHLDVIIQQGRIDIEDENENEHIEFAEQAINHYLGEDE